MLAGLPAIHFGSDMNKVKVPVSGAFGIGHISGGQCGAVPCSTTVGVHREHRATHRLTGLCYYVGSRGQKGARIFPGFPADALAAASSHVGHKFVTARA